MKIVSNIFLCVLLSLLLSACGFQLQGKKDLAPPLRRLFLQTPDPYGFLVRSLTQYLRMSDVQLVNAPEQASTILVILQDAATQDLLSVSGTQQTRQYLLKVTVVFSITDAHGRPLLEPQTMSESQTITIQSSQILGSSNEASLFYQQMRRTLAYSIMNRIASRDVTNRVTEEFHSR